MYRSLVFLVAALLSQVTSSVLVPRANLVPHVSTTAIKLAGSGTSGAYPRLAVLPDNSLLGSFTSVSGTTHTLRVTRSTDGGSTFSSVGTIATSTGDLDNAFLLGLSDGTILAAFRNHDVDANRKPTYYRITVCKSTDKGATWTFVSQVVERSATTTNNGVWEPFLRLAADGSTVQVYYASENSGSDQDILMQSSKDKGATWSSPITVAGGSTTGRDGMPGVARFSNGTLICIFETTEGSTGRFNVKSVYSTNDGASWGSRSTVYIPTAADSNAGAPQVVIAQDTLVASIMTDEDSSTHNWSALTGIRFKVLTAAPAIQASWGHKTLVTADQAAWPSVFTLSTGTVYACGGSATCYAVALTAS
ncbi:glycoside hydrolase family 93 protein [Flagelloscypha sp. PMI_526]|nr:glycoside hydrolase family 93 protein [Flagelloscypha sp. PMI_526]